MKREKVGKRRKVYGKKAIVIIMRVNEVELMRTQYIIIFIYDKFCRIENNSISANRTSYSIHLFSF